MPQKDFELIVVITICGFIPAMALFAAIFGRMKDRACEQAKRDSIDKK